MSTDFLKNENPSSTDTSSPSAPRFDVLQNNKTKVSEPHNKEDRIAKIFAQAIHRFPLKPGEKVLVAVSGGADSVCLLHLLRTHFPSKPLLLHVAHLNHGLRPESVDEARFVEDLCKAWKIPLTSEMRSVLPRRTKDKVSIQSAARALRYQFLEETAKTVGASWIALGHTADDQAETVLMRTLRGAGMEGLSGIPERRDGGIIRPLLHGTRQEILDLLSHEAIAYIEDPSNHKTIYHRNHIRHVLLPNLEQYNPKIKAALCRQALLLQDENDFMDQAMQACLQDLEIEKEGGGLAFAFEKLSGTHPALQRRALRWAMRQVLGQEKGIDFQYIEALRQYISSPQHHTLVTLPFGLSAEIRGSRFHLSQEPAPSNAGRRRSEKRGIKTEENIAMKQRPPEQTLFAIGNTFPQKPSETLIHFPEWNLEMKISFHYGPIGALSPCIASLDFDKLSFPLSLRGWRNGDRFSPLGMGGKHKKLQDFFVDAKILKPARHRQPILSCSKGIVWLVGLRIDDRFRASEKTLRTLTLTAQSSRN